MFANMLTTCYLFTGFQVYASCLFTIFTLCMLDTCYSSSLLPGLHLLSWPFLSLPLLCLHHWFSVFFLFTILITFHWFLQGEAALTERWQFAFLYHANLKGWWTTDAALNHSSTMGLSCNITYVHSYSLGWCTKS